MRALGLRRLHGLRSREEVFEQTILSRFVSLLSPECYTHVLSKNPKDGMAAATMVQEFEETRGFARRQHHWNGHSASQHHPSSSRVPNDLGYTQQSSHGEQHGDLAITAIVVAIVVAAIIVAIVVVLVPGIIVLGNLVMTIHLRILTLLFSLAGVRLVGRDLPGQRSRGKGLRGQ